MIVVKLLGGLGNQMFQYAIGKMLALKHNTDLQFDDNFFEYSNDTISTKRELELDVFNLNLKKITKEDLSFFLNKSRLRKKIESKLPFLEKHHLVIEKTHTFSNSIFYTKNNSYLNGYWQSENYFKNIREILLKDFSLKNPVDEVNAKNILKCKNQNTVSIHIRRGDYVSIASNLSYHGVCSLQYYYDAINFIKGKVKADLNLIVFTDDENWVNENFKPQYPFEIIKNNKGKNSVYDMFLMSKCHHNIIANSSFSWWGAWLNTHPDKIVVAPEIWFTTSEIDSSEVVPENWIRL